MLDKRAKQKVEELSNDRQDDRWSLVPNKVLKSSEQHIEDIVPA